MNVKELKAASLEHWRYGSQCLLVALEASCKLNSYVDGGQADVLAVTKNRYLIETEVKMTLSDVHRDKKKEKHQYWSRGYFGPFAFPWPTAYFYFCVPAEIATKVVFLCDQKFTYAGVLGVDNPPPYVEQSSPYCVSLYRRARKLPGKKLSLLQLTRMAKEQSGTVCRLAREVALR